MSSNMPNKTFMATHRSFLTHFLFLSHSVLTFTMTKKSLMQSHILSSWLRDVTNDKKWHRLRVRNISSNINNLDSKKPKKIF